MTSPESSSEPKSPLAIWSALPRESQYLAVGLVAILIAALAWQANSWRTEGSQREFLLGGHDFTPTELQAAVKAFGVDLTDYEVVGARIRVPLSQQTKYLAALGKANALPGDFRQAMDHYLTNQRTWWTSATESRQLLMEAKQDKVSRILQSFPGVSQAAVTVTEPSRPALRGAGRSKASVKITTSNQKPLDSLTVEQIRNLVVHSFDDLAPDRVAVVGDVATPGVGVPNDADTALAKSRSQYLQIKEAFAYEIEKKIGRMFPQVDGVSVVVNVEVDPHKNIRIQKSKSEKGPPLTQSVSSRSNESQNPAPPKGEPGVRSNVDTPAVANQGLSAPPNTESDESTKVVYENAREETSLEFEGHTPQRVGVVINIPRDYLVLADANAGQGAEAPADKNEKQPLTPKINSSEIIDAVLSLKFPGLDKDSIRINPVAMPEPISPIAKASVISAASAHVTDILFGILGFGALACAAVVVLRKPTPTVIQRDTVDTTEAKAALENLAPNLLPKIERQEDAEKLAQLRTSVTGIITENSSMAAGMVRRWLEQE